MQTISDPGVQRLVELDVQARQLRSVLLEMTIKISVPGRELRDRAFAACVNAGLLTSPYQAFYRDFNDVIAGVTKGGAALSERDGPVDIIVVVAESTSKPTGGTECGSATRTFRLVKSGGAA